jgi:hypothetical protein
MKKFLVVLGAFCAFLVGYGATTLAFPSGGVNGRGEYNGYFTNVNDTQGTYVLPQDYAGYAIPSAINSASEFINFIKYTKLDIDGNGSGNAQEKTGAAYIIHTMIGSPAGSRNRPPTSAQIAEWERRVNYASSQGRISWSTSYSYKINSFYQGAKGGGSPNDDAMYDDPGSTTHAIVFRNSAGNVAYALRRECANPVGNSSLGPIPDDVSFNMDGHTTVSSTSPKPGDTITFRNYVKNLGPGAAPSVRWTTYNSTPSPDVTLTSGGPNSYADNQERNVHNENYTVPAGTAPGTRICREVGYTPDTAAGGSGRGAEVCATVRYDFGLTPAINIVVNGTASTGSFAEVGDKVEFVYTVRNTGSTVSQSTNCSIFGRNTSGYRALPGSADTSSTSGYVAPGTGCPRTFPRGSTTTLVTETIDPIAAGQTNTTLCRSLSINPIAPSGGTGSTIGCISIANKPYLRAYGGDVSAGNGQGGASGTCTNNGQAAVVGWNSGSGASYAGAGGQFGVIALRQIYDFASAQGNTGGAPAGSGLAFANTAPSGSLFGGSFGSVPCITDYYATNTNSTLTSISSPVGLAALPDGAYRATAPVGQAVQIGGTYPSSKRAVVYVDGDVLITSDIKFPGNWTAGSTPYFQLIVRGNIYISKSVKQLDGIYVAQRNGSTGGFIYTCANPGLPAVAISPTGGTLYGDCGSQLIVNGSFVAYQVQLLRTYGTLRQGAATERGVTSSHAAEIFNYNPTLWMALPPGTTTANDYDSITSLPPTL